MGIATLILGLGDSFHLVPRVLDYFVDKDFSKALGVGKLVTSITMTIFFILHTSCGRSKYNSNARNVYATKDSLLYFDNISI